MEDPRLFVLAALTILCVSGPTNTLLATGGASVGVKRALPLLLGEEGGYLIAILIVGLVLGPLIAGLPAASLGLRLIVGTYLYTVAWSLWRRGPAAAAAITGDRLIKLRNVFVTTLFNPKAIVVVLGIVPLDAPHPEYYLIGFLLLAATAGTGWIVAGALLGGAARATGRVTLVPRIGAARYRCLRVAARSGLIAALSMSAHRHRASQSATAVPVLALRTMSELADRV
jgi:threonine/homoserine/homoserine lactone efflux protein